MVSETDSAGEAPKLVTFGKYLLLDRIATGGMADVWLGKTVQEDGAVSDLVAIKRLLTRFSEDSEFLHMFIDEARIAGQLDHPGIAQIHELGKVGNSLYIAMEFVWGRDLLGIVRRLRELDRAMEPVTAAYVGARICEALHFAHTATGKDGKPLNVVHRDVSPQNILVSFDGKVKLIDFGIAKAASRSTKTQAGTLKGKVGYMSPEQVRGDGVDHRSDIFAAGTVLYEMITGRPLFSRPNNYDSMELVREADVPPLLSVAPECPPRLAEVVMKALAKEPDARWQTAREMQRELTLFLTDADSSFERFTLVTWLRSIFREEMAEEKARLDALDHIGRPAAAPVAKHRNTSTRLEIGAFDLFDEDDEADTRIFDTPFAKVEIVRPAGPYEVFFHRGGDDDTNAAGRVLGATFRPGGAQPLETRRPAALDVLGPYPRLPGAARDGDAPETSGADATGKPRFDADLVEFDAAELNSQVIRALLPEDEHRSPAPRPRTERDEGTDPAIARGDTLRTRARRQRDMLLAGIAGVTLLGLGAVGAKVWLGRSATASVQVSTVANVPAEVILDEISRGNAPLRIDGLPPGHHTLTLRADGYAETRRDLVLAPSSSTVLELPMTPRSSATPIVPLPNP